MSRTGAILLALALASNAARAEPGSVTIERGAGASRLEATLPGEVLAQAFPKLAGGGRDWIVLLAAPQTETETGPAPCPGEAAPGLRASLRLVRVDRQEPGGLVELRNDLPGDAESLDAADLDGDGVDEWLLARPGAVLRIDGGRLEPLLEDAALEGDSLSSRAGRERIGSRPFAVALDSGRLRLHAPAPPNASWTVLADVALPLEGAVRGQDIVVRHPLPDFVGLGPDGAWLFATRPAPVGRRRLRVQSIVVPPAGTPATVECWARLPEDEQVLERHFLLLDERPVLLVATKPADKLSLFGEKRLRLYSLEADRSHRGVDPLLAVESGMNLWQPSVPSLHDVNADGRADLVIGYWKGLTDDRIVLDSYLRMADGSFDRTARTTAFNVEDGDRSYLEFGRDLDGDGSGDLLLRGQGRLSLYRGRPSKNGASLVETKPRELAAAPSNSSELDIEINFGDDGAQALGAAPDAAPRFVDLDGDGRSELLWLDAGGTRVSWLRLD